MRIPIHFAQFHFTHHTFCPPTFCLPHIIHHHYAYHSLLYIFSTWIMPMYDRNNVWWAKCSGTEFEIQRFYKVPSQLPTFYVFTRQNYSNWFCTGRWSYNSHEMFFKILDCLNCLNNYSIKLEIHTFGFCFNFRCYV